MYRHLKPDYRLIVNGKNITPLLDGCLSSLTITDNRHLEADTLEVILVDHKGELELPPHGAIIEVALGFKDEPLIEKGSYVVDEVEHVGDPDQIIIRARSADLRAYLSDGVPAEKSRSWHQKTVAEIVSTIAGEHGLTPKIGDPLGGIRINHIDQTHESDANFLTRLGERYDALFAVKENKLLFMPIGQGMTITGQILKPITVKRDEGHGHRYLSADRDNYTGIISWWNNVSGARRQKVVVGSSVKSRELKETYASEADAQHAAQAELNRLQRAKTSFSVSLVRARLDLIPETPLQLSGYKAQIDQQEWVVTRLVHQLGEGGLITDIEAELKI